MQEKLSKLKYKFKTEVKSGKSGYMLYAAVLAGILCIAVLKAGGKGAVADTDNCTAGLYRQCRQYRTGGACRRRGKAFFGGTGGITQTV